MLLLVDAKLVTIVVVLRIPRRKKRLPGVQWTLVDDKSKSRICGERKEEGGV